MRHLHQMTDLQLEIMNVIWARGEATVAQVHAAIEPRQRLARKTVGTLLSRLDAQGVLAHREEGREYVYRATVARAEVERATIGNVLKRLFRGDVSAMVSHALEADDVRPGDVERLQRLLERRAEEGEGE
jgi:BlaI family transcriptional regulator, penicillinase repressor